MNCRTLVVFLAVLLATGCYSSRAEQTETRDWPSTGITALITRSCLGSNHDDA